MIKLISSLQNAEIKKLIQLAEKSRVRKKEKKFVVEGFKEVLLAQKGNFRISDLYYCPEIFTSEDAEKLVKKATSEVNLIEVTPEVYSRIAYRGSTEGIIAIAEEKESKLENLSFSGENPLILIAEAPEKPGNIGALFRTADAANLDAVIIANPKTDNFNPNIIRSSLGCIFTVPFATGNSEEIIEFLKKQKINIFSAVLEDSSEYTSEDFRGATAIVVGTEAVGLSKSWINAGKNIIIPMQGEIDSMNVSVAAGILIFEAKRQRNFQ